jgi:hypothetical protein
MIDLLQFCSQSQPNLAAPWSRDGVTYATDGAVILRVAIEAGIDDNPLAPDAAATFDRAPSPNEYAPIPDVNAPTKEPCGRCCGDGYYDCECCDHERECPDCGGSGMIAPKTSTLISGARFDDRYLALLGSLPNCQIGITGQYTAARIRFDGGDGLLMPLKI